MADSDKEEFTQEEVEEEEVEEIEEGEEIQEVEEGDEDEDYEEYKPTNNPNNNSSAARKKPKIVNQFLDIEAVDVSDDDEDEEEEEVDTIIDDESPDEHHQRIRRPAFFRQDMEDEDLEKEAQRFEEKYRNYSDYGPTEEMEDRSDIKQQSYLPSVKDPKLWLVRCKLGKERECTAQLLQKCLEKEATDEKIQIKSAISCDNLKGYIYVEAEKEAHVKQSLNQIRNLFETGIKLVPIREMVDVLKVSKKPTVLEKNSWIRVTRGTYRGDLGQVIEYDDASMKALVKLIPRLDLSKKAIITTDEPKPEEKTEKSEKSDKNDKESKANKKKRALSIKRPPQKFFSGKEIMDLGGLVRQKRRDDFEIYGGQRFKGGYMYKSINIKSLEINGVVPTLDELQRFQEQPVNDTTLPLNTHEEEQPVIPPELEIPVAAPKANFAKGDTVIAIQGDLKHLMGVVESIDDGMVTIMPKHEELHDLLTFPAIQLQKYFQVGDHCKVIAGRFEGETGLIVKLEEKAVLIFSDLTHQEISVNASDIQECSEVTSGKLELGIYELHDLVQINNRSVGVIVKVERDSFKVLDSNGVVHTIRLQEMGNKRNSKFSRAFDRHSNQLAVEDMVQVIDGKGKGRQGVIKHIFRSSIFIHSNDVIENSGIYVVFSKDCVLLGGTKTNPNKTKGFYNSSNEDLNRGGRGGFPRGRGRGRGGAPRGSRGSGGPPAAGGPRGDWSLIHKTVTIKAGAWKGYVGIIVDANESTAMVELHTNCKTVKVDRQSLSFVGEEDVPTSGYGHDSSPFGKGPRGRRYDSHFGQGPSSGQWGSVQTPIRESHQTPLRSMGTPLHSHSTPSHDSIWNPNHPNTPMRSGGPPDAWGPSSTDDWGSADQKSFNNNPPPFSPYRSFAETPQDASFSQNPTTPSGFDVPPYTYSNNHETTSEPSPYVPNTFPATPQTPGMGPNTPGTPSENSGYDSSYEEASGRDDNESWLTPNIVVVVVKEPATREGGNYKDSLGVIKEVLNESTCRVAFQDRNEILAISADCLTPAIPEKKHRVKVIRGRYRESTGTLIGIDQVDGIVKIDTNFDIKIIDLHSLARLA
eukprot:TRINITY_DN1322_c0_g3_i1.p1 TRINITY_DN1322_c0_g3~~TRINITY_DN1322_c0_g3_i1.p1  ORF type:complete len:1141 (-),score=235.86 TRINITY_DN1322_c0_g3_i1:101-3355(-)